MFMSFLKINGPYFYLQVLGVVFSTFAVGTWTSLARLTAVLGLNSLGLSYVDCLLFGALIAPTDPIAVLAMVKNESPVNN